MKCAEGGLGRMLSGMASFSDAELLPYGLIYLCMALFHLIILIPLAFIDPTETKRVLG